jgi:hypothetical protein
MSIEMHFVNGHTIMPASGMGRWKIRTRPGKARFFAFLKDARKWARINPPTDGDMRPIAKADLAGGSKP